jgi:lysyl-tRNA synthetase class 1
MKFSIDSVLSAKSWPFVEAKKILDRIQQKPPSKGFVLLETGYGPSGLPHIGTFCEVARTTMIQHAFSLMSDIPARLFAFSDDMDGLRKVPGNVPNQEMLAQHLGKPLTLVPDPYEQYESFGHHNNAMLCRFLDSFGFEYEFKSSTSMYKSGVLDDTLLEVLRHYDEIMAVMLPSLRQERSMTYSPFLPICPNTGVVLQVPILETHPDSGTIVYTDPQTNKRVEIHVTGGRCKLQWKVDWAGRWRAFEVDYEMSGKDLIDSVKLSNRICKILGKDPPETMSYELFLDHEGKKISKSKGNGLTIDEWLTYAPQESLAYYMFQTPRRAKRLSFDVIPKAVDEYLDSRIAFAEQSESQQLDNPVFHIHRGNVPVEKGAGGRNEIMNFSTLMNLAVACGAETEEVLWGFVQKYIGGAKNIEEINDNVAEENLSSFLKSLIRYALRYYHDFIKPNLKYREPSEVEKQALLELREALIALQNEHDPLTEPSADVLQGVVFSIGNKYAFNPLRLWFKALYEVLLGSSDGPRMGSFIALYGVQNMCQLISDRLSTKGPHILQHLPVETVLETV